MSVRVLSFHAAYGCRHSGRCCTSGWPIAVEAPERAKIEHAIAAGALEVRRVANEEQPEFEGRDGSLLGTSNGRCVFHDDDAGGGCRIHRALGHSALPLACRQFPRHSVHDPRGFSVTLSHYCPTAAGLLETATGAVSIAVDSPAFPRGAEYVGLTADSALPPLLHPQLAMDWESWWLFEELSVALISDAPEPLPRLGLAVEWTREWQVGHGSLSDHVRRSFENARAVAIHSPERSMARLSSLRDDVLAAVPEEWREVAESALSTREPQPVTEAAARRYLAAHAFANWSAHLGEGLRTWFRAVETAGALLELTADPGRADLVLRHLADSRALVDRLKRAESQTALNAFA